MILWVGGGGAVVVWAVAAAETLSGVSTWLIVQLSIKTRASRHLRRFSSVWGARSVLVGSVSLWALCHLAVHVATPTTPLLCKLHVALSLGLFQPAFLVALLFLLNSSLSDSSSNSSAAFFSLLAASSLAFFLQVVVLFFLSEEAAAFLHLPDRLWRSSYEDHRHVISAPHPHVACTCAYPLLSTAVFGSYAAGYAAAFAVSACAAASAAINKSLRLRIRCLAVAVVLSLPVQVALLAAAGVWRPGHVAHDWADVAAFLAALGCAAVGEGVLVVKPIADSLAVMGRCCPVGDGGV